MGMSEVKVEEGGRGEVAEFKAALAAQSYLRRGAPARAESIRVVLVDDHEMVREGLRLLLRTAPDIDVVGEADNGVVAVAVAERLTPEVILLDLDMPGGDGIQALSELHRAVPGVRVLILTMYPEEELLLRLLEAGASGYLSKEAASRELIEAIRVVAGGQIYVRPEVARLLAGTIAPKATPPTARGQFQDLSGREQDIVRMIAVGYNGVEIASSLGISRKTVDTYKRRIQDKLGLDHRTDYVRFGMEAGLFGEGTRRQG